MMLVVEFGSRQRGDFNSSSDRDVLLLGPDWTQLTAEKLKMKEEGFSVSCFTLSRARHLIQAGSLFFKHVIDEGALVLGSQQEYDSLIANWHPAASYEDEIEDNLDLLDILEYIPKSEVGLTTTIDIVVSSVRNILIRKLAAIGEYVFAWEGVLGAGVRVNIIKYEDVPVFLIARTIKNAYRQGKFPRVSLGFVNRLVEGAERVFGGPYIYRFAQRECINGLPERYQDGTYKQLRALELLCAEYSFDRSLKLFFDWVREPSYFSAHGPNRPIKPTH